MYIAVLGKGGSGKSSVSWLLTRSLQNRSRPVLAIDADHNMDLSINLGVADTKWPTLSEADAEFRGLVGLEPQDSYKELARRDLAELPTLSFPEHDFFRKYVRPLATNLYLLNGGLGRDEVLFGNKCAHAYLSPLKYLYPLISEDSSPHIIVDSVAGIDMVNFGLYAGIDAVLVVVENHPHSRRVLAQITRANETIQTPVYCVLNKFDPVRDSALVAELSAHPTARYLGHLTPDPGICDLTWAEVDSANKDQIDQVTGRLATCTLPRSQAWGRITRLDTLKLASSS